MPLARSLVPLALVVALAACTPARYAKPGADEAQVAADLAACREIAARQGFRDRAISADWLLTRRLVINKRCFHSDPFKGFPAPIVAQRAK